ncbi:MAG TPA: hypothetical protein VI749_07225 [Candidatus Omnitrophota bacterium]|nr:hypothetical protein [Candidatus Omnitrophota bacterium]
MNKKEPKFKWKEQSMDEGCETIECPAYDEYKDFRMEPSGHYLLIKVDREKGVIEVAVCTKMHKIIKIFRGKSCQQVYHHLFKVEKQQGRPWLTSKEHIAYFGKELKKAEEVLRSKDYPYIQE